MLIKLGKDIILSAKRTINRYSEKKLIKKLSNKANALENKIKELESNYKSAEIEANQPKVVTEMIEEFQIRLKRIEALIEDLDKPFLLFLMGMGKYGKSTLLNALVGSYNAEIDDIPKTWKIDIFQKKKGKKVKIHFKDGQIKKLNLEEAKKFLAKEESKREKSEIKAEKILEKELKRLELDSIREKEELKAEIEKSQIYYSPVVKVEWPVENSANLLDDFRLVDTPGLIQDLLGEVKVNVKEYYHQADGVIWLLDATKISAKKAHQMLEELDKSLEQMGGRTDNIIAVLNKIDIVQKRGGKKLVKEVKKEAEKLFADIFTNVIAVSAKEAFKGRETEDKSLIKKSGILDLEREIKNKFLNSSQNIRIESKKQGLEVILSEVRRLAKKYKDKFLLAEDKRSNLEHEFKKELNEKYKNYSEQAKYILLNYEKKVFYNITRESENLFEIENEARRKQYIIKEIFRTEELEQKLTDLQNRINSSLIKIVNYYRQESYFKEYKYLKSNYVVNEIDSNMNIISPEVDTDLEGAQLGLGIGVSSLAAIIFGPLGLLIGGLSSYFGLAKWMAIKFKLPKIKKKFKQHLDDSVKKIRRDFNSKLESNFAKIKHDINSVREKSFASLYGSSDDIKFSIQKLDDIEKS